ncbi:MAG: hypothetical protein AB7U73_16610 [Pirellulales bacterium]
MSRRHRWKQSLWASALGAPLALAGLGQAADDAGAVTDKITRQVTFELTFANSDLVWGSDPGSPNAMVSIKPAARPVATDVCVRTLTETHGSPFRRYMREARIVTQGVTRTVHAFTKEREKVIGTIDEQGQFTANDFYRQRRNLLPTWPTDSSLLRFDADENALYYEVEMAGPQISESLDFLPLEVSGSRGNEVCGQFSLEYQPADTSQARDAGQVSLVLRSAERHVVLATATVPGAFRRGDVQLGSFDNASGTYWKERDYRSSAAKPSAVVAEHGAPCATFSITHSQCVDSPVFVLSQPFASATPGNATPRQIAIDGNFDDWRNVPGVDDPRGDVAPYLDYDPDVDLLEFKVANDNEHIYLYARVAGQVGQSHARGGRSYFYAYMDVDRNAETGFLPTRDDDCYFGVDIGDDCEVQFEFVDGTFRKTFYGFCGLGGDENVLEQIVTLGKSQYGRLDERGHERAHYKSEYIYRRGAAAITEDLKLGTSDTIRLAVSPDGREVEIVSELRGFLKNAQAQPTLQLGQQIDVAAGMECSGRSGRRDSRWAADSTPAIRGYTLKPVVQ